MTPTSVRTTPSRITFRHSTRSLRETSGYWVQLHQNHPSRSLLLNTWAFVSPRNAVQEIITKSPHLARLCWNWTYWQVFSTLLMLAWWSASYVPRTGCFSFGALRWNTRSDFVSSNSIPILNFSLLHALSKSMWDSDHWSPQKIKNGSSLVVLTSVSVLGPMLLLYYVSLTFRKRWLLLGMSSVIQDLSKR